MKLPEGANAVVDQRKLTEYALNPDHDDGKHKARLFSELLGLNRENASKLVQALVVAARDGDASVGKCDRFGQRYRLDFPFTGPAGTATIRSIWIVRVGNAFPELVTCYII